jgi:uncharacterized protein
MKTYRWPFVLLGVLSVMALLGGCSAPAGRLPAFLSGDAVTVRNASGTLMTSGQPGEGVVVSGTGMASAEPDLAQLGFGVELQGQNADALVSEAAAKMGAALAAAEAFGVVEDKTQTLNYNLWVETVYNPETGRPTGEIVYHLSHQVQVTTDRIGSVGELLSGVVNAGANAISGVNFVVEDTDALERQAREAALRDAQSRAEQLAGGLAIPLGAPILVVESGTSVPGPYAKAIGLEFSDAAASPSFNPGSFSVSVNVQIVYAIR